jgi:uncharacterized protein YbcI
VVIERAVDLVRGATSSLGDGRLTRRYASHHAFRVFLPRLDQRPAPRKLEGGSDEWNAMVKLHKEQFGRGPTSARSGFAGPDSLLCVLDEALLPAELKMAEMGEQQRVREARLAFQAATASQFIGAVEEIIGRKVRAFGSALDVDQNVVFETFVFERESGDGDGRLPGE